MTPIDSSAKDLKSARQRIATLESELAATKQQDRRREASWHAIAQSEAFLAQSTEMAHLGYAVWDDTLDRDVTVSEELAKIHGLSKDEYVENVNSMEKYLEFVVVEDRDKYMDYEKRFSADDSGAAAGIEYRITRPNGEIRHLQQRSQYVPVASGKPTQSIVVVQDITELKQMKFSLETSRQALEESEAMLIQSVAMANLGHAVWDYVEEKYVQVSVEWARIFGYSRDEFLTKFRDVEQDSTLIHPDDADRYRNYYEAEDPDNLTPDIEYRVITRSNEIRHILQSHRYVLNESGERTKSLVTIQDITDRIEHEIELDDARKSAEQASVAKSSFLALMSHEIRTPLNAVLGTLGLIDSKDLQPSLRKYLQVGRNGAENLLLLINDILDFSKMEAGKLQLEPALFNVQKTIDDVVQVLELRASKKDISLGGSLDPNVPKFLIGDASRIRQVLLNLCSNAVRFTGNGGVKIKVAELKNLNRTSHLRFEVKDTGCGVPKDDQMHLFEEFWGTNSTSQGDVSSTGLGLAICKQLVDIMGGSIGFQSAPGRGSNFWFDLPLGIPNDETIKAVKKKPNIFPETAAHKDLPSLQGRVLLAEDNSANQLIGQAILERLGLRVDVVANGHEVIAALRSVPYDVVLMDINMPEMDGIEAATAIRKMPGPLSRIPIIAMTAAAMAGDREIFLSSGMDGYISKPIIREELYAGIAKVLGNSNMPVTHESSPDEIKLTESETEIFDADVFSELRIAIGKENLPRIVDLYLAEVPVQISAITAAAAAGNCDLVATEAHNLKSSSGYLGAKGMAKLAAQLEYAALAGDLDEIAVAASNLPSLFANTRANVLRDHSGLS